LPPIEIPTLGRFFKINALGREDVSIDVSKGSSSMDYAEHVKTYETFIRFTKYSIVFLVVLLAGMKLFLVG